jgi:SusD family.
MKKIINFIAIALLATVLSGCEDFLDSKSYTTKDTNSFPLFAEDADMLVNGVYAMLNVSHAQGINSWIFIAELASDDRLGGGGKNDIAGQSIAHLMYTSPDQFNDFWSTHYRGISRANQAIAALEIMEDGPLKSQKIGEVMFLRAHWFFELVQLFGDIPLPATIPQSVLDVKTPPEQAPQKEVYKAIASDLWNAYNTMPADKAGVLLSGTVTKWSAAALLARVYLFYTGFYGESSLPMTEGEISNAQVVAALEDVINNSGHELLPDYRTLWPYTNAATKPDYEYAKDAPTWLEGSANKEVMFQIKYNPNASGWGSETTVGYSNSVALFFSPRDPRPNDEIFPMGQGWGMGTVNSRLWDDWLLESPSDPRRKASIYSQEEEANGYTWGRDMQVEETGMWNKKICTTAAWSPEGDYWITFWRSTLYGSFGSNDHQMGTGSDLILIRFADVLLMHSELKKDVAGINRVRARVGLDPVAGYSDAALRSERRFELALEGLRWGDIRRWGIAGDVLDKAYGIQMRNLGAITTFQPKSPGGTKARYEATKGFFHIPLTQIDLSDGTLTQNAGWGGGDSNYLGY